MWFTPITNIGASLDGADIITFLAPPSKCFAASTFNVNKPVDSITVVTPKFFQLISEGFFSERITIFWPLTIIPSSSAIIVASQFPWTESYFSR